MSLASACRCLLAQRALRKTLGGPAPGPVGRGSGCGVCSSDGPRPLAADGAGAGGVPGRPLGLGSRKSASEMVYWKKGGGRMNGFCCWCHFFAIRFAGAGPKGAAGHRGDPGRARGSAWRGSARPTGTICRGSGAICEVYAAQSSAYLRSVCCKTGRPFGKMEAERRWSDGPGQDRQISSRNSDKARQLTQRQLAGELDIERHRRSANGRPARALPEVSLMLPLCQALHITVN